MTGQPLKLVGINDSERRRIRATLLERGTPEWVGDFDTWVRQHSQAGPAACDPAQALDANGRPRGGGTEALDELGQRRRGRPFSVVMDAANVAYCRQNYDDGCFSFAQIELVLRHLQAQGEEVLVLLPAKYTDSVVPNHIRRKGRAGWIAQKVTSEEHALVEGWARDGLLYRVPPRENDDWYWIYCSLIGQSIGDEGADAAVVDESTTAALGKENEFPACSPPIMVVSNDQMRDHWLDMMAPRAFRRWKQTQVLRFDLNKTDFFDNGGPVVVEVDPRPTWSPLAQGAPAVAIDESAEDAEQETPLQYLEEKEDEEDSNTGDSPHFPPSPVVVPGSLGEMAAKRRYHLPCREAASSRDCWLVVQLGT